MNENLANLTTRAGWVVLCASIAFMPTAHARNGSDAPVQKEKIAILNLKSERGLDEGLVKLLNELLLTEFERTGKYEVIGGSDVEGMLKLEQKKLMMKCDDVACLSEIGGALGVEKLGIASIGRIGDFYLVNVKIVDVREARVEGRVSHKVRGIENQLISAISASVQELVPGGKKAVAIEKPEEAPSSGLPGVEASSEISVEAARVEAVPPRRGVGVLTWVMLGGAGVLGAAGLGFGLAAGIDFDEANRASTVDDFNRLADAADDKALAANILYGAACAAAAVTVILLWLDLSEDDQPGASLIPAGPGGPGLTLAGTF